MIEIYLDGVQLEVPQDISIGLNLGIADYTDPCTASGAYTQTVEIPRTPHNDLAFKMSGEILSAEQYNHTEHTARIVQDGCELIGGKAYLEGLSQHSYNLQIVGEEIEWVAKIRDKKLSELEGENIGYYRPDEWSELYDVSAEGMPKLSWVLLQHGCWFQEADDEKIRRSWITYQDLVPIVKLYTLLEHIFSHYEIVASDSLKELLHRTYSTMKWSEAENASVLEEDMGFEITSELKNADSERGELSVVIDADNRRPTMSLFDTIVEDKGGVLTENKGVISFTPTEDCTALIELKTKYQTTTKFHTDTFQDKDAAWVDVALGNPEFADQLFIPDTNYPFVQFDIKDSIEWRNKELFSQGQTYKYITIDPESDAPEVIVEKTSPQNMCLMYVEVNRPELIESVGYSVVFDYIYSASGEEIYRQNYYRPTRANVASKMVIVANQSRYMIDKGGKSCFLSVSVAVRGKDGKMHYPLNGDPYGVRVWSLSTDQRLTFDVALRIPPQRYNAGQSYTISQIAFGSSGYGEGITVYGSAEGSLKPNFGWGVPIREGMKLSDIGGDTAAESMLRSIMQLYNLLVYTDPKSKRVYLHSFADFWHNDKVVDWRNRVDADSDITITYVGDSIGKEILLSFAEGSPRIDYYNERHKLPYSAFKKALPNKMTSEAKEVQNETLTPPYMVSIKEEFGEGEGFIPAVALPDKEGDVLEFNLAEVPNTLMLIDTSGNTAPSMPPLNTAVFGDVGGIQPSIVDALGNTTISFADKEGKVGMHQYYDKQIALWEKGKRLVCYCRVEAWEIEALRYNSENINFRSLFHLNINGEDIYARLESIEYEPSNTTNKCTFIIE